MTDDIRYYMGRHKIRIITLFTLDRKAWVVHLEDGIIGSKELGRKVVFAGDKDILYWRCCWREKK